MSHRLQHSKKSLKRTLQSRICPLILSAQSWHNRCWLETTRSDRLAIRWSEQLQLLVVVVVVVLPILVRSIQRSRAVQRSQRLVSSVSPRFLVQTQAVKSLCLLAATAEVHLIQRTPKRLDLIRPEQIRRIESARSLTLPQRRAVQRLRRANRSLLLTTLDRRSASPTHIPHRLVDSERD